MVAPESAIDRQMLKAQIACLPAGHMLRGPADFPPYWRCDCGEQWSNEVHPPIEAKAIDQGQDQALPYPLDS